MKIIIFLVVFTRVLFSVGHAKLMVVCALPDFADIAKNIGGQFVEVSAVAKGNEDPHFIDPKPSFIARLAHADLAVVNGMELDQWMDYLIENSRNPRIQKGQSGYLDASVGIPILDIPTELTRAKGDLHPQGNPHYMLNPLNGVRVADTMQKRLAALDPQHAAYFQANFRTYSALLNQKQLEWKKLLDGLKDRRVITYHRNWTYFADAFNLELVGELEPKPGITPPPSHMVALSQKIAREKIKVIIIDPFHSSAEGECFQKDNPRLQVLVLPSASGGDAQTASYNAMFDYNVRVLYAALKD